MVSDHKSVHKLRNMNTIALMARVSGGNGTEVESDTS